MLEKQYQQYLMASPQERAAMLEADAQLIETMLQQLGNEQAAIRDQLNYRLFIQLVTENALSAEVLHHYVTQLTSKEGMLFELGAQQDATVFRRASAALFLTAIVHADRQLAILTEEEFELITKSALDLFEKEQDLRSFVDDLSGYAHSVANSADLLTAIIQHPNYPIRFTAQILQAIRQNLWKGYVFCDDEEERFCTIVEAMIVKGIDEELLIEWFEQLYDRLEMVAFECGYDAAWFKARTNLLNVSKTLYFYLKFSNRYEKLRGIVSIFIQRWLKLS